jgi:hypothetical protein
MAAKKTAKSTLRLSPNLPLIPGNSVTFLADGGEGVATARVISNGVVWEGAVSSTEDEIGHTVLLERSGPLEITFYRDGKEVARGSYEVA